MKRFFLLLSFFIASTITAQNNNQDNSVGPENLSYPQEEIGIQGNWRKKKDWLKQAVEKNDEIQEMVSDVQQNKKIFQEKFEPVDGMLDKFYQEAGIDKGELGALIEEIDQEIETTKQRTKELFAMALSKLDERTKDEAIKIKEQYADAYSIEEQFKQYKNGLDQLSMDLNGIVELDKSLRTRLKTAEEQVNTIQENVAKAEELSEKIWHMIDDKKAKKIFYDLSSIHETTKGLKLYIQEDLVQDFDTVVSTLQNQIQVVNESIDRLEQQKIIVRNRTARLEEERKKQQELLLQEQEHAKKRLDRKKRKERARVSETWYGLIWDGITSFFSLLFSWLY